MVEFVLERGNYWAIIGLMMIGLYIAFAATNLIKRLIGLGTFQTSIILFYVSLSRIDGGTAPILMGKDYKSDYGDGHGDKAAHGAEAAAGYEGEHGADHTADAADAAHDVGYHAVEKGLEHVYSNPLPHVLMLTAIVVGVATLAVGLAIIVRIREAYGTVEIDEINQMDLAIALKEAADEAEEVALAQGTGAS